MNPAFEPLIAAIHRSGARLATAVTGGGSQAIGMLLSVPGASRTVLEAIVPYSAAAFDDWLGRTPSQYCSAATARAMAMRAWERVRKLDPTTMAPLGLSCTASLASDRPKQGPHRAFFAVQTSDDTIVGQIELTKGARSRAAEEQLVAELLLSTLVTAMGLDAPEIKLLPGEELRIVRSDLQPPLRSAVSDLLLGKNELVTESPKAAMPVKAILPGAFNPVHPGHWQMAQVGGRLLGSNVDFELSVTNVDKPPVDFIDLARRVAPFDEQTLWITRAPTFAEKAKLFAGATFLVGVDTVERIVERRYYRDDADLAKALDTIAKSGCRFLVFGRKQDGGFRTLGDLALPPSLARLCKAVPESDFRLDVSSTEVRNREEAGG